MQGRYFIQNIGNGPAINIVVKTDLHNGKWDYGFLWNSLQSCSNPESMNWTTKSNIICALYLDSFGHNYISYMENNNLITIDCLDESSVKKYSKEIEKSKLDAPTLTWKK